MSERPWTHAEVMDLAARGAGKVDLLGPRGATLVSVEETIAMGRVRTSPRCWPSSD